MPWSLKDQVEILHDKVLLTAGILRDLQDLQVEFGVVEDEFKKELIIQVHIEMHHHHLHNKNLRQIRHPQTIHLHLLRKINNIRTEVDL